MAANQVLDPTAQARRVAEQWYGGWADHDVERMAAVSTDDVRWTDSSLQRPIEGKEDLRRSLKAIMAAFPDVEVRQVSLLAPLDGDPNTFASRWRLTGTFRNELSAPGLMMTVAPTGDRVDFQGVAMVTVRDGLVSQLDQFADSIALQRQIGSLPEPGSRTERFMQRLQALGARRRRKRNGV